MLMRGALCVVGFFVVKGVDSVMRRTKKGPVSQLIDHWNHVCSYSISSSSCHWLHAYFVVMVS